MNGWLVAAAIVGWLGFGWMAIVCRAQLKHIVRQQSARAGDEVSPPPPSEDDLLSLAEEAERDGLIESGRLYRDLHAIREQVTPTQKAPREDNMTAVRRSRHYDPDYERERSAKQAAKDRMKACLRAASREEYGAWLTMWAKAGGRVSHYDYPMKRWGVWVADRDLHVEELCGSWSLGLILVPRGVTVTGAEPGHTDIAWMDGSRTLSFHGDEMVQAPAFSDVPVHA